MHHDESKEELWKICAGHLPYCKAVLLLSCNGMRDDISLKHEGERAAALGGIMVLLITAVMMAAYSSKSD